MNIEIANRLLNLRKEKGLSQEQLAEKLGISRQAVSKWERAEASPDTDNLICLAKLYGVSLDFLLSTDESIEDIKTSQENAVVDIEEPVVRDRPLVYNIIESALWLSGIVMYVFLGVFMNLWHPGWLIFIGVAALESILEVFEDKQLSAFNYVFVVLVIYLLLGFENNLWHPYWVLFVTIPLYYSIIEGVDKLIKRKNPNWKPSSRKNFGGILKINKNKKDLKDE